VAVPALAAAFAAPDSVQGHIVLSGGGDGASPEARDWRTLRLEISAKDATFTSDAHDSDVAAARVRMPAADARQLLMKQLHALRRAGLLESMPFVEERDHHAQRGETEVHADEGRVCTFEVAIECRDLHWSRSCTVREHAADGRAAVQWNAVAAVQAALARLLARR
jgi:hypothetical protein